MISDTAHFLPILGAPREGRRSGPTPASAGIASNDLPMTPCSVLVTHRSEGLHMAQNVITLLLLATGTKQ
jgi:hypothetical protein